MKINFNFYKCYSDDIIQKSFDFPNNSLVTELNWTRFGQLINKDKEEYCHDYYVLIPHIDSLDDKYHDLIDFIELSSVADMYNPVNKSLTVIRFYSCAITNDVSLTSLEDLNSKIDFSDEFYRHIYKNNSDLDALNRLCIFDENSSEEQIAKGFKLYYQHYNNVMNNLYKTLSLVKVLRLAEDGILMKVVNMPNSMASTTDSYKISHVISSFFNFTKSDMYNNDYLEHCGSSIKQEFEDRIQQIINF